MLLSAMRWRRNGASRGPNGQIRGAFTLIELLVVVAIIAILASIAVPNFLDAQTRAKVSRVLNDMRVLETGMQLYYADHSSYPPRSDRTQPPIPPGMINAFFMPWFPALRRDLGRLTTPVSYITVLPLDVFDRSSAIGTYPLDYVDAVHLERIKMRHLVRDSFTSTAGDWYLQSVGPDGYVGVYSDARTKTTPDQYGAYPLQPLALNNTFFITYDPTNGTNSVGNIFRFAGQRNPMSVFIAP